nr:hypothetical protein [Mesorhizobium mediterraneum]
MDGPQRTAHASIVERAVQTAVAVYYRGNCAINRVLVAHVAGNGNRLKASLAQFGGHRLGTLEATSRSDNDCALACK